MQDDILKVPESTKTKEHIPGLLLQFTVFGIYFKCIYVRLFGYELSQPLSETGTTICGTTTRILDFGQLFNFSDWPGTAFWRCHCAAVWICDIYKV